MRLNAILSKKRFLSNQHPHLSFAVIPPLLRIHEDCFSMLESLDENANGKI